MIDTEETAEPDIVGLVDELERFMKLPSNSIRPFLMKGEPEWVFTLRTCAMVETALKDAVAQRSQPQRPMGLFGLGMAFEAEPPIIKVLAKLPLNGSTGIVGIAREYDLLDGDDVQFISALCEVRNRYAHNIRNHERSILDLVSRGRDEQGVARRLRELAMDREWELPGPAGVTHLEIGLIFFLARLAIRLRPPKVKVPTGILTGLLGSWEPEMASEVPLSS